MKHCLHSNIAKPVPWAFEHMLKRPDGNTTPPSHHGGFRRACGSKQQVASIAIVFRGGEPRSELPRHPRWSRPPRDGDGATDQRAVPEDRPLTQRDTAILSPTACDARFRQTRGGCRPPPTSRAWGIRGMRIKVRCKIGLRVGERQRRCRREQLSETPGRVPIDSVELPDARVQRSRPRRPHA